MKILKTYYSFKSSGTSVGSITSETPSVGTVSSGITERSVSCGLAAGDVLSETDLREVLSGVTLSSGADGALSSGTAAGAGFPNMPVSLFVTLD